MCAVVGIEERSLAFGVVWDRHHREEKRAHASVFSRGEGDSRWLAGIPGV